MRPYHLKKQEHEKNHIRILQEKGEQRVWDACYKRIVKGHKYGTGIDSIHTEMSAWVWELTLCKLYVHNYTRHLYIPWKLSV